ncbi:TPA: XRE family transcriptional regulator [Candidatus Poribacteria bacterium]|nr:XRE family transcriptional regulator [Candidatus Poribacteria bacterium]
MNRLKVDSQKLRGAIWGKRAKVASFLGIHPNSLSRKINGKQPLTIEELNEIASYLNQDTKEFLKEVPEKDNIQAFRPYQLSNICQKVETVFGK